MVLVDADRVEAAFRGVFELVHEVVVHVMRPPRVEQRRMNIDPHRGVLLPEVVGELGVGHQMEPHLLHGSSFRTAFRKSRLTTGWPRRTGASTGEASVSNSKQRRIAGAGGAL